MFQLKVSSIRLRGTRQFPRRKCRTKVGQLRFQESGGGGGECIKRGHWRNIFRERGEGGKFELNFEMKFRDVKIFSQEYIYIYIIKFERIYLSLFKMRSKYQVSKES